MEQNRRQREGGIFCTNNKELFDKALLLASMGRTDRKAVFWSDSVGYQYTIGNLQASLALAQVERIDELVARKRQIFDWYEPRFREIPASK
jgi:perosamine synthetase